MAQHTQDN